MRENIPFDTGIVSRLRTLLSRMTFLIALRSTLASSARKIEIFYVAAHNLLLIRTFLATMSIGCVSVGESEAEGDRHSK
jgi:hypothetical protein